MKALSTGAKTHGWPARASFRLPSATTKRAVNQFNCSNSRCVDKFRYAVPLCALDFLEAVPLTIASYFSHVENSQIVYREIERIQRVRGTRKRTTRIATPSIFESILSYAATEMRHRYA